MTFSASKPEDQSLPIELQVIEQDKICQNTPILVPIRKLAQTLHYHDGNVQFQVSI